MSESHLFLLWRRKVNILKMVARIFSKAIVCKSTELMMCGVVPPLSHMPSCCAQGQLNVTFKGLETLSWYILKCYFYDFLSLHSLGTWIGPYKITAKISNLNYEILGKNDRRQVVHIKRLKPTYGYCATESKARPPRKGRAHRHSTSNASNDEQSDVKIATGQLAAEGLSPPTTQPLPAHGSYLDQADSPLSEQRDPTYVPGDSPRSRREMREPAKTPTHPFQDKVGPPGTIRCRWKRRN